MLSALFSQSPLSVAAPVPPCPAPFPSAAVPETWCSTVIATNAASGVVVAQYGAPAGATLVTATTNAAVWYDAALFFLGGGIEGVFSYMGGRNAANESIIHDARTVPFVIRSPLTSASGLWETSMMVSPAHYPDPSALPAPLPGTGTRLEPLGMRTFATLDFNSAACPPIYVPPYFTAFQRCDAQLAAGLPSGWVLATGSPWTPAWLIYNAQGFNGTWTSRCLAEVAPSVAAPAAAQAVAPAVAPVVVPLAAAPAPAARANLPVPHGAAALSTPRVLRGSADAPPICAIMLEFETVYWGAWTPPHAPNVAINIDGGTLGQTAKDDANGVVVFATAVDTPSFGLGLVAITVATGAVKPIGNNWPSPPPGFTGVNGLFAAVEFDPHLGFVMLLTEISRLGPVPTRASEPGTPVGWTVAATVDIDTGSSTALTPDLSPALAAFPALVNGLSALDPARALLWLLSAEDGAQPYGPTGCRGAGGGTRLRAAHANQTDAVVRARAPAAAPGASAFFLGVPLSASPPLQLGAALTTIPALGGGFIVTAFEYASSVDAIVSLEFDASGVVLPIWVPAPARVVFYPVNGSAPVIAAAIPGRTVSPAQSVGASQVSADGRFVYFGATQGPSTGDSASLVTVDAVARTASLVNAAPSDDYDVFNLYRC